jgi:hypothetical protein
MIKPVDRLLEQVLQRLPDLSLWDTSMHLNYHGKLVIENRLPGSAHRIVTLFFQRDARGASLTGYPQSCGPASVLLPSWNSSLATSLLLSCLVMESMTKEDQAEIFSIAWSVPKTKGMHKISSLKMLQTNLFKSIVYSQGKAKGDPIKYPPIISACMRLLRHRYLGFDKDDINKAMEKVREKFAFLAGKGLEEEDILTAWRECLVGHVHSA